VGLVLTVVSMTVILGLKDGEQRVYFRVGGEWCYLWTPAEFKAGEKAPVVIHHNGARGYVREGEADWLGTESKAVFLRAVMEGSGCVVAGSHACGDHWGNGCAIEANTALLKMLDGCTGLDTSRLGLMGGGLGGALIWNSILGPFAGRVKLVAVLQAVANLDAAVREHKFKDVCLRAYGLPEDTPDDEAVEKIGLHDPLLRLRALGRGTKLPKTAIYHGFKD